MYLKSENSSVMGEKGGNEVKLLLNTDPGIPHFFFTNEPSKKELEYFIDVLSLGEVDLFAYCIFEGGYTLVHDSMQADPHPSWTGGNADSASVKDPDCVSEHEKGIVVGGYPFRSCRNYRPIYEAGEDPIKIYAERCRSHGMKFIAGFRMNDRHPGRKGRFQMAHPEWQIKEPGSDENTWRYSMDFSFPEVRNWLLEIMTEAVQQYSIDGIELDYMRGCCMFPPSVAPERHPVLTDFMGEIRKLLDSVGEIEHRRLLLGARVPQRLEDCRALGYDITSWIKGGLVDYLCPSDFMFTDFNAPYEEFTRLAGGTGCSIYPSIHPVISHGLDGALLNPAQYRAAARTFYGAGADGLSLYNFQYHWQQRIRLSYPGSPSNLFDILGFVRELRNPSLIDSGTRHYLFYPLWPETPPSGAEGVEGVNKMTLLERNETGRRKTFAFRVYEHGGTDQSLRQILFNAVNMRPKDEITVDINGTVVDPSEIQRLYDADGIDVDYRRCLPPYSSIRFYLKDIPLKKGENELGLCLESSDPNGNDRIEIQEVEITVFPELPEDD